MFVDYPQQFCENGNNGSIFSRSTLILLDTLISNFNTPGTLIFPDTLIFPYLHPCMTPPSCFQLPSFGTFPFFLRLLPAPSVLVFLYLVTLYLFTFRLPVFFALLFRTSAYWIARVFGHIIFVPSRNHYTIKVCFSFHFPIYLLLLASSGFYPNQVLQDNQVRLFVLSSKLAVYPEQNIFGKQTAREYQEKLSFFQNLLDNFWSHQIFSISRSFPPIQTHRRTSPWFPFTKMWPLPMTNREPKRIAWHTEWYPRSFTTKRHYI